MKTNKPTKYALFEYLDNFSEPVRKSAIAKYFNEPTILADLSDYVSTGEVHKFCDDKGTYSFMLTSKVREYLEDKKYVYKQNKDTKLIAIIALIFSFAALIPSVIIPIIKIVSCLIPQ